MYNTDNEQGNNDVTEKDTVTDVTPIEGQAPESDAAAKKNGRARAPKAANKAPGQYKPKEPAAEKQAFMYLGPNVPGGVLFTGSIYKELPEHLEGVFEKTPEIKELFIEIKSVPAFKAELGRRGSEANRLYQNALSGNRNTPAARRAVFVESKNAERTGGGVSL